jgi:uncharacterized RDD family membrane protein YckC
MSQENPYAAPKSVALENESAVEPYLTLQATRGMRLGTFIIDYLFVIAIWILIGIASAYLGMIDWIENMNRVQERLFDIGTLLVYYMFFEGLFGRTPGKWIIGTKTVDLNGNAPSLGVVFIRSICRFVPFEPFSFFGNEPNGWHDRWSKTRVVSTRKLADYRAGKIEGRNTPSVSEPGKPENWHQMSDAQKAIWEMEQQQKS